MFGIIINIEDRINPIIILYNNLYFFSNRYLNNNIKIIIPIIAPKINGIYKVKFWNNKKGFITINIIFSYIPRHNNKNELLTPGNIFPNEKRIPPTKYLIGDDSITPLLFSKLKIIDMIKERTHGITCIFLLVIDFILSTNNGISLIIIPNNAK